MPILAGQKIIVMGGSGLIGRRLVAACLRSGAAVVVAGRDRNSDGFQRLKCEVDVDLPFEDVDICNAESVKNLFSAAERRLGPIDAVVNCTFPRNSNFGAKFEDVRFVDFCENVNMHLGSAFLICQEAMRYFSRRNYGCIVNFSSIYGLIAPRFEVYDGTSMTKEIEYIVCKSAIISITEYLAKYLKGKNIRVNCVSPGGIADGQPKAFIERYNKHGLNKGMLDSDDVAGTVVFLLSDQAKFINGQNIVVDDGYSL